MGKLRAHLNSLGLAWGKKRTRARECASSSPAGSRSSLTMGSACTPGVKTLDSCFHAPWLCFFQSTWMFMGQEERLVL